MALNMDIHMRMKLWLEQDINPYDAIEDMFQDMDHYNQNIDDLFLMLEPLIEQNNENSYYYLAALNKAIVQNSVHEVQTVFWKKFTYLFQKNLESTQLEYFLLMDIFMYEFGTPIWETMVKFAPDEQTLNRINLLYEHDVYANFSYDGDE